MVEDFSCIWSLVERATDGDEVSEELIGLVEVVAEEMAVDFGQSGSGFLAMEKLQELSLHLH